MMMKKRLIAIMMIASLLGASCVDKIATAKIVLATVGLAISTTNGAFQTYAATKKAECLKVGPDGSEAYVKCYAPTKAVMDKYALIEPKIQKGAETAAEYIKAVESGESKDYATAVKATVCLLTEVYDIIPDKGWEKLKKKIAMYVALAGAYACTKTTATPSDPEREYKLLKLASSIFKDLLGGRA